MGFLRFRVLQSLFLGILLVFPAWGDNHPVFEVRDSMFTLDESMLMLNADIDIELPDYIVMAIDQGFAVPIRFEVEILQVRRFWFDKKIVSLKQRYLLHFLPMLDSYVVSDVSNGQRYYFNSRTDAINSLKQVVHYPMFDIGNIGADLNVYARIRFGLDSDELPLPLKSSSLWDNDWHMLSDWFDWEIDQEFR